MRNTLPIGQKFSVLGFGGGGEPPFVFKTILVPSDFPTIALANESPNTIYVGGTAPSVIDNDPTKTDTGFELLLESEAIWDPVSQNYYEIGAQAIWVTDDIGNRVYLIIPRNIDLQTKGFIDANVTTPLKIGDPLNTILGTTNKTIIGGINELITTIGSEKVENITAQLGSGGETNFTASFTIAKPENLDFIYNGNHELYNVDFTVSGNTIIWISSTPLGSSTNNTLVIKYNKVATPTTINPDFKARIAPLGSQNDKTGDGTVYTVIFGDDSSTGFYNYAGAYNASTGQYTATVPQLFNFGTVLRIGGNITALHSVEIGLLHRNSGGTPIGVHTIYSSKPYPILDQFDQVMRDGASDFKLAAGETLEVTITGFNSTKTISIEDIGSQVYGHLISLL